MEERSGYAGSPEWWSMLLNCARHCLLSKNDFGEIAGLYEEAIGKVPNGPGKVSLAKELQCICREVGDSNSREAAAKLLKNAEDTKNKLSSNKGVKRKKGVKDVGDGDVDTDTAPTNWSGAADVVQQNNTSDEKRPKR